MSKEGHDVSHIINTIQRDAMILDDIENRE